jgi:hypothetical protein
MLLPLIKLLLQPLLVSFLQLVLVARPAGSWAKAMIVGSW